MWTSSLPLLLCIVGCCGTELWQASGFAAEKPNVLFIAVDDLRPELGCYGASHIRSPNIDRLAGTGMLFERAYCQQAVCNPSRASLMTGLRPDTTRVWDLPTHFRDQLPDVVTIAQLFKQAGYHTERLGKIYHVGHGNHDDKLSWSRIKRYPSAPRYGPQGNAHLQKLKADAKAAGVNLRDRRKRPRGLPWEAPDVGDSQLGDGRNTDHALKILREVKHKPFFLAVGYYNPHLPFVAPKKYWDLYDRATIKPPRNPQPPQGANGYTLTNWGELRNYFGMPKQGPLSASQTIEARHGYYAAVSYVDAQVGRLLDELDRLGLAEKTVVVLWGDHGWKLGEHGAWCKHTNMELDARAPLIIRAPGIQSSRHKTRALVEFVDIYPTLAELAGLAAPKNLEGLSVVPLLKDPDRSWKSAVFSQYPRGKSIMGYSMKTDRYRYTEWRDRKTGDVAARELYDHQVDPGEDVNIAGRPRNEKLVRRLSSQLSQGWLKALPQEK